MAEFPYPEYRNLWRGSKLSKDMSALGKSSSSTWQQTDEGVELTVIAEASGASSYLWTNSSHRVQVESDTPYSWAIPFKNTGDAPFPLRVQTWLERTTSGSVSQMVQHTLMPGEAWVARLENLQADNANDIRWSIYYGANDAKPAIGAKLAVLDGITLVQSETAPPFPFNGDGVMTVETLLRRNLAKNPLGPNMSSIDGMRGADPSGISVGQDSGRPVLQVLEIGNSAPLFVDSADDFSPPVGTKLHLSAEIKVLEDMTAQMRVRVPSYNGSAFSPNIGTPDAPALVSQGWVKYDLVATSTAMPAGGYTRALIYPNLSGDVKFTTGSGYLVKDYLIEYDTTGPFFDGDTPASGNLSYRYAPDGTSLEIETTQPPTNRTVIWDGAAGDSTSTLWVGDTAYATGVMDLGAATDARLGIVADVYSRSQEKIKLTLAVPDENLVSGRRVELSAAAYTGAAVVWRWRQITGPTVELEPRDNNVDFIAPDVGADTTVRIGVYAASEDGRNRSDWHFFDLTIKPPTSRFRSAGDDDYVPTVPSIVGYGRGRREIWNDVVPPAHYWSNPRHEVELIDLGVSADDVQFSTEQPKRCAAGGIYVNPETGDVFRNFGPGYNETSDTTGSPRKNAYWLNPATGDILEWRGA